MHELSLVQGLFEQVKEAADSHGCKKVYRVKVKIGPFSGVVIDSFTFAFEALKKDHELLSGAELQIVTPRPRLKCSLCGREVTHDQAGSCGAGEGLLSGFWAGRSSCPSCKDGWLFPAGGDDIVLLQIEME